MQQVHVLHRPDKGSIKSLSSRWLTIKCVIRVHPATETPCQYNAAHVGPNADNGRCSGCSARWRPTAVFVSMEINGRHGGNLPCPSTMFESEVGTTPRTSSPPIEYASSAHLPGKAMRLPSLVGWSLAGCFGWLLSKSQGFCRSSRKRPTSDDLPPHFKKPLSLPFFNVSTVWTRRLHQRAKKVLLLLESEPFIHGGVTFRLAEVSSAAERAVSAL